MRRVVVRAAFMVALVVVTVVMVNGGSGPGAATQDLTLTVKTRDGGSVASGSNVSMSAYWGQTSNPAGNYRAACMTPPGDVYGRVMCTIVFSFDSNIGTLVAQGVVEQPTVKNLFAHKTDRNLAVTGATNPYKHLRGGYVDLTKPGLVKVVKAE